MSDLSDLQEETVYEIDYVRLPIKIPKGPTRTFFEYMIEQDGSFFTPEFRDQHPEIAPSSLHKIVHRFVDDGLITIQRRSRAGKTRPSNYITPTKSFKVLREYCASTNDGAANISVRYLIQHIKTTLDGRIDDEEVAEITDQLFGIDTELLKYQRSLSSLQNSLKKNAAPAVFCHDCGSQSTKYGTREVDEQIVQVYVCNNSICGTKTWKE